MRLIFGLIALGLAAMDFDTAMLVALPASFLVFLGAEALLPSRREMPAVRHWRLIGLAGLALTLVVFVFAPLLIVPYLPRMAIVDLQRWGNWAAIPLWVMTTFLGYWAHRTMHYFDTLWRAGHQLHHGVARVDISSAMIFHPFDALVQGVLTGLLAAGLLHSTAHAAAWAGLLGYARSRVRPTVWAALAAWAAVVRMPVGSSASTGPPTPPTFDWAERSLSV